MRKVLRRMGWKQAFTLVELMIVVTIVAILALIAIPLYSANTTSAIMAEGVAGAGTIRNQLRIYCALNGGGGYSGATLPTSSAPGTLQLAWSDLQGKYFAPGDYTLVSATTSTFVIKAGPPSQTTRVSGTTYYEINEAGSELGTYYTNQ
jgi:prepilin-type N-terminal cleavage/methylation domain-containing protein